MAALDFPDSPIVGDTYGSSGTVWRWTGDRWASTSGIGGSRGIVARPGTLLNSMFPVSANVVTAVTPAVSFTFKAGRTYRCTLKIRAIDTNPGGAGYRSVQLLFAGAAYGDYYTYVAAPYMGLLAEFLISYPVDTTTTVAWAMYAPMASTIHPNGNDSYIEDVTFEAGAAAAGVPGAWTPFVPVVTASVTNPTLGTNPTILASYMMLGKMVTWRSYIAVTAGTPNPGSGSYFVSLPVPTTTNQIVGTGWMYGPLGFKPVVADGLDKGRLIMTTTGGYLSNAEGFAGVGHVLAVSGTYEVTP